MTQGRQENLPSPRALSRLGFDALGFFADRAERHGVEARRTSVFFDMIHMIGPGTGTDDPFCESWKSCRKKIAEAKGSLAPISTEEVQTMLFRQPIASVALMIALVSASASRVANAAFIQGALTGHIDGIDESMETTAALGDPFTATYLIDLDTPDLWPTSPIDGVYDIVSTTVQVGDEDVTQFGPDPYNQLHTRPYAPITNMYAVHAHLPAPLSGISSPCFWIVLETWELEPPPLADDSIPTTIDLDDFEWARISFQSSDMPGPLIQGQIETFDLQVVPEPTTAALVVAGLSFVGRQRHRRAAVLCGGGG